MPRFSKLSKARLSLCHEDLQKIMNEAIKVTDFSIIEGYRGKEDQDKAFARGRSQLKYPKSKHNKKPSLAVDIAPYPVDWGDINRFKTLAKVVMKIANEMKENKSISHDIIWGGNWKKLKDYPHFEIA